MSDKEAEHFQALLTQWWGQKSLKFITLILSATVSCIGAVAVSTWKVSAELHNIHTAIERNGYADATLRAEMDRIVARVVLLEGRPIKP